MEISDEAVMIYNFSLLNYELQKIQEIVGVNFVIFFFVNAPM